MTLLERIQCLDATRHPAASGYATLCIDMNIVGSIQKSFFQKTFLDVVTPFGAMGEALFGYRWSGEDKRRTGIGVGNIIRLDVLLAFRSSDDENEKVKLHSEKLDEIADYFVKVGIISKRHEDRYPVLSLGPIRKELNYPSNEGRLIATIDRNLAPFFGIDSVGVHLLCFVKGGKPINKDGNTCTPNVSLWMAQRSAAKSSFPNKWDPTVAGGQPNELSLFENLMKEAYEEAGIPSEMSRQATSAGCLSQMTSRADGSCMKYSKYFVWDLGVAKEFRPYPRDGEVQMFELWDTETLLHELKQGDRLRPAMRLVVADFLIRHGIITPDNEPQLAEIQAAMHQKRLTLCTEDDEEAEGRYMY